MAYTHLITFKNWGQSSFGEKREKEQEQEKKRSGHKLKYMQTIHLAFHIWIFYKTNTFWKTKSET